MTATAGRDNNASESQVHVWSRPKHTWNSGGVNPFTANPCGLMIQEMPHGNNDSTPIAVFLLFFIKAVGGRD
jgi:hypothetical protein